MHNTVCSQHNDGASSLEFEDVVERFYRPLFQFAFSLTRCEADAGDLTQQTFYTWRTKGSQLRDPSKVRAWLFTTMHRAFLQSRRREARFPHFELGQVHVELPCVAPDGEIRLDGAEVIKALNRVDELFRAPVSLFYLEDYAYKDIALILNVPLGTVKSRIARGITQLKELLAAPEMIEEKAAA